MKKKILVTYNLFREGFNEATDDFEFIFPTEKSFDKSEIITKISDCDALLSMFNLPIDKEIIDAGKNLKIISNFGVGFNNIDIAYAQKKGIVVTNTPDPVIEPTAELAFTLMSDLSRRVSECNRKLQYKEPIKWGVMENLGTGLYNKTLGILGMGRIGQAVARRAIAAGMHIIYHNRHRLSESIEEKYKATYVSFDELLKQSDYISIHTPLDESTYHLMDEKALNQTKEGVFIINTARGAVIDEKALVYQLEKGHIGGVGSDVFEKEPEIEEGLLKRDNVVIVPHIGTATIEARNAMSRYAVKNIMLFFEGKDVLSRVI
ncbi:MAG: NAD(P)-binding domain-containing protein [Paludibacteraceae bacterium]|nr:NAD(P)-binding domain-containing protein [Paludibacteraceae bacterium]